MRSIVTLGLAATLLAALDRGGAILGTTSARLQRLGPGGTLNLRRPGNPARRVVRVAGMLPDRNVGAHELLVWRRQAAALGQRTDRYLLVEPAQATPWQALAARIRALLPPGARLRIRGPGQAAWLRQGDAVLPQALEKALLGEFAARPTPAPAAGSPSTPPSWRGTSSPRRRRSWAGSPATAQSSRRCAARWRRSRGADWPGWSTRATTPAATRHGSSPATPDRAWPTTPGARRSTWAPAPTPKACRPPGSPPGRHLRTLGLCLGRALAGARRHALRTAQPATGPPVVTLQPVTVGPLHLHVHGAPPGRQDGSAQHQ
jgi:hypothetical protein